jgi:hypothetical protein
VKDNRTVSFLVKCYVAKHSCERVWVVKELSAPFLANQYIEMIRDNDRMSLKPLRGKCGRNTTWSVAGTNLGELGKQHWQ